MKNIYLLLSAICCISSALAQTPQSDTTLYTRQKMLVFEAAAEKVDSLRSLSSKERLQHVIKTLSDHSLNKEMEENAQSLSRDLMALERPHLANTHVTPETALLLSIIGKAYTLMLIADFLERETTDTNAYYMTRLAQEVQDRLYTINYYQSGHYVYKNNKKTPIKFIHVQSGNDLFRPASVSSGLANAGGLFQRNDDMDYTGSLRIEIGTDYLNTYRRRGLKSYQVLYYGFDVYTPYFKDLSIFSKADTFNVNDRPHGSFQYFGWGKRGLSVNNAFRWSIDVKMGIIGSDIGYRFQKTLHQDVSDSPLPRGWGAQIANGGRLGWSVEYYPEWQLGKTNPARRHHLQTGLDLKLGSFMTHGGLMLRWSNKRFSELTHHNIGIYKRGFCNNIHYALQGTLYYIQHNSMLQGYGITRPLETSTDTLFRISRYRLADNQVRNITGFGQLIIAYTFKNTTVYYQYRVYSPETFLGVTGSLRPGGTSPDDIIDLTNRWHRFGVLGISFNLLQHKGGGS